MRPRKTILCVCGDENKLSQRKFLLDVWGYHVTCAGSVSEMHEALRDFWHFDLMLVECPMPLPGIVATDLDAARKCFPDMRTLVIYSKEVTIDDWCADGVLGKWNNSPAEVREKVKILTSRKRGPKPRTGSMLGDLAREFSSGSSAWKQSETTR